MTRMRRWIVSLAMGGVLALVATWPMWRITVPCDPRAYLPFGSVILGLTLVGVVALLAAAALSAALFLRLVLRTDAAERRARRAAEGRARDAGARADADRG